MSDVLDASPDAVLVADSEGCYAYVNHAAIEMLGYSREEFLGMRVSDLVAGEPEWAETEFERYKIDGSWRGEVTLRCKDGALITLDANASVGRNEAGEEIYVSVLRYPPTAADDEGASAKLRTERLDAYQLSRREREVLALLARGFADKQIASHLRISVFTVNKHVGGILLKMRATSRTEASVRAISEGLVSPSDGKCRGIST
jgi:PAS domain S-box-containing protein